MRWPHVDEYPLDRVERVERVEVEAGIHQEYGGGVRVKVIGTSCGLARVYSFAEARRLGRELLDAAAEEDRVRQVEGLLSGDHPAPT